MSVPPSLLADARAAFEAGDPGRAEALCRRLLAMAPAEPEALNLLGLVLCRSGRGAEGAAAFAGAVAAAPGVAAYRNNLGTALSGLGRHGEAAGHYRKALELGGDNPRTRNNLATVLRALGRPREAADQFERALAAEPGNADTRSNYGNVLLDLGRLDAARAQYLEALRRAPDNPVCHNNFGVIEKRLGRYGLARAAFQRAIELAPGYVDALANSGEVLKDLGDAEGAVAVLRRALALAPGRADVHDNLLLALQGGDVPPDAVFAEHKRWGDRFAGLPAAPHANRRDPGRRLAVGYVSADLRRHSVAYFLEPVLEAHDRAAVRVTGYSATRWPDAVTERLRGKADAWVDITGLDDQAAAARIRADGIDVLVDLSGHTAGSRLALFAYRPAPVQVTWLGYPDTTGLAAIDARIVDAVTDPPGWSEAFCTETLVRLAGGFLCYRPPDDAPPVSMRSEGEGPVFGSFNNLAKVSPRVLDAWAEILRRLPSARLVQKSKPLGDNPVRQALWKRFADRGVAPGRVELRGWIVDGDPLAAYHDIDIALDTFPYNGTTTTCEALWMGVPVVSLLGTRHAGRVGASLLGRVGLGDLVAADVAGYVETAVALAGDRGRREDLRASLRGRMAPLVDSRRFCGEVEATYRELWWRRRGDPAPAAETAIDSF